jgi:hypothetical protein
LNLGFRPFLNFEQLDTLDRGRCSMDEFTRTLVVMRWREMLQAVSRIGGRADPLRVEPPAILDDVLALEQRLGMSLPAALRDVLLTFSRGMDFCWFLPDDYQVSEELRQIFSGRCNWSMESLERCHEGIQGWIREVFPDQNNEYDAVWHGKFAFQEVGNGDYLAIDVGADAPGSVVYLSHDDGRGHGRHLGADFQDFLLRWSRLGCVGAEDWQWLPFTPAGGYLDPSCDLAKSFRNQLGVNI